VAGLKVDYSKRCGILRRMGNRRRNARKEGTPSNQKNRVRRLEKEEQGGGIAGRFDARWWQKWPLLKKEKGETRMKKRRVDTGKKTTRKKGKTATRTPPENIVAGGKS